MSENGLLINQIIVFNANGITIFTKNFRDSEIDSLLLSAFFSAIRQFAANMSDEEIEGIKIGGTTLDFKILPMENIHYIFVMVSRGFGTSDSDQIADKFAESFAINFDTFLEERDITYAQFEKNPNKYLEAFDRYYSSMCDEILKDVTDVDSITLDMPIKVPRDNLKMLYDFLVANPSLESLYHQGTLDMLIETIHDYIHSAQFKKDIKAKYGRK